LADDYTIMIAFITDENISIALIDSLRAQVPTMDIVRVQEVGLLGADDPTILEWADTHGRILLTNDRRTIPDFVYQRLEQGLSTPGVIVFRPHSALGVLVKDIVAIAEASEAHEWVNQVIYIPL
jgi:predicted nuclease of predicted toxin-antitoxin system